MRWFHREDLLSLDISELNFAKKNKGKKPSRHQSIIPLKLTRRHRVSKLAEIFDLTGKTTPIAAIMKMDLHNLVKRGLDWDDVFPDKLQPIWASHFEMMKKIGNLKFHRAVITAEAVNLNIYTIETADVSNQIACAAIYAGFFRRNESYSCQLISWRSKIITDGLSQSRAELLAATMNAHTGEIVRRSLQSNHKGNLKLTDSQMVVHWINNIKKPPKQWFRNRVVEIVKFTEPSERMFVSSQGRLADLGT